MLGRGRFWRSDSVDRKNEDVRTTTTMMIHKMESRSHSNAQYTIQQIPGIKRCSQSSEDLRELFIHQVSKEV